MEFYETIYIGYEYFNVHIDVLHLGEPELCQDSFPKNLTFADKSSPKIYFTLCGVPQPVVLGHFVGQTLVVQQISVNNYTHKYTLQLPQVTQIACGKELTVTATGRNSTIIMKTRIFVVNCKFF